MEKVRSERLLLESVEEEKEAIEESSSDTIRTETISE